LFNMKVYHADECSQGALLLGWPADLPQTQLPGPLLVIVTPGSKSFAEVNATFQFAKVNATRRLHLLWQLNKMCGHPDKKVPSGKEVRIKT
ncbi:MAG: hypothetical protein K6A68_00820, partial [Clostridiales bacterium]|nr:hypothetical protein [Clostridiales bacterium]